MPKLMNKTAIITGGNRGIGKATALLFAEEGVDVVISYHTHEEEAKAVVEEIQKMGRKAYAIQADISNAKGREALATRAIELLGKVDHLVNNAGVYYRQEYLDIEEKDYDQIMTTNLKGIFFFTQLIARLMIWQNTGGSIVNISSFRDQSIAEGMIHYAISKSGLTSFSNSLAIELAKHNIRVNTVSPGMIETNMLTDKVDKNSEKWKQRIDTIPLKRAGTAKEVAESVLYFATSEYATGGRLVLDGGRQHGQTPTYLSSKL